jgi:hypothetical protein
MLQGFRSERMTGRSWRRHPRRGLTWIFVASPAPGGDIFAGDGSGRRQARSAQLEVGHHQLLHQRPDQLLHRELPDALASTVVRTSYDGAFPHINGLEMQETPLSQWFPWDVDRVDHVKGNFLSHIHARARMERMCL